jgi:hypothetical protein
MGKLIAFPGVRIATVMKEANVVKKQTSARVSSLAGANADITAHDVAFEVAKPGGAEKIAKLIRTLCASALSQDEKKGN